MSKFKKGDFVTVRKGKGFSGSDRIPGIFELHPYAVIDSCDGFIKLLGVEDAGFIEDERFKLIYSLETNKIDHEKDKQAREFSVKNCLEDYGMEPNYHLAVDPERFVPGDKVIVGAHSFGVTSNLDKNKKYTADRYDENGLLILKELQGYAFNPCIFILYSSDHQPPLGTKQDRYKNDNGKDTIDKWAERYPIDVFREIMWCQMEKYRDRLGKKDLPVNEVRKIADYAVRWLEVEEAKSCES